MKHEKVVGPEDMAHKTKKKTVKELNDDFNIFEEKFKSMEALVDHLNAKIVVLEKKIEETPGNFQTVLSESSEMERVYDCKLCDFKSTKKKNLKVHIKEKHRNEIKCKVCGERFNETFELEIHLKTHDVETFKCTKCEKSFYLKWRLEKHMTGHEKLDSKFCHYFNNNKKCPFEQIGCMFKHAKSSKCWFKTQCKNKLCQYAHDIDEDTQNIEKDTTVPLDKADVTNDNINTTENVEFEDSDLDSEDLECDTCGKIFLEHHELSEHNMEGTCGYGCEDCGAYYRYEKDLKLHMQRHCTKCFDEFYPKSVLEAHKKVCNGIEY